MTDPDAPRLTRRELRKRANPLRAAAGANADTPIDHANVPRVLMVCTGNVCRSPMAEAVLRARLGATALRIHSAGTRALVGKEMPADAKALALAHGASPDDVAAHRARWLLEPIAEDADLILAMSREHRTTAVELAPHRLRQTFTVREFARLSGSLSESRIREAADAAGSSPRPRLAAVIALIAQQRGTTGPALQDDDEVIDPYRRSRETYEKSAAQLVPAIDEVARVLRILAG